jgi:hypothetical protein
MNDSIDPQKNLLCQFRLLKQPLELQTQRKEKYFRDSQLKISIISLDIQKWYMSNSNYSFFCVLKK